MIKQWSKTGESLKTLSAVSVCASSTSPTAMKSWVVKSAKAISVASVYLEIRRLPQNAHYVLKISFLERYLERLGTCLKSASSNVIWKTRVAPLYSRTRGENSIMKMTASEQKTRRRYVPSSVIYKQMSCLKTRSLFRSILTSFVTVNN